MRKSYRKLMCKDRINFHFVKIHKQNENYVVLPYTKKQFYVTLNDRLWEGSFRTFVQQN